MEAKPLKPATWGSETSYKGRLYEVGWRDDATMVNMYKAYNRPSLRHGLRAPLKVRSPQEKTIAIAITAFPSHLASATTYLLAGEDGNHLARMLFLPRTGPPEIKYLRVTLNQILAKLDEAARSVDVPETNSLIRDSSDEESEQAAISADEDEEGSEEKTSDVKSEWAAVSVNEDGEANTDAG